MVQGISKKLLFFKQVVLCHQSKYLELYILFMYYKVCLRVNCNFKSIQSKLNYLNANIFRYGVDSKKIVW